MIFWCLLPNGAKNDYIRFEYIGNADKSMQVVYISTKPIPDSEQVITVDYDVPGGDHLVKDHEFLFIKKSINSVEHKSSEKKDYNGFKITFRENDAYSSLFIRRKNSNSMFSKIINYLMQNNVRNNDLIDELTWLKQGNVFEDPK